MKSLTWYVGCIATVLAASVFYPRASFAIDCSYQGVFNPPLPIVDGTCAASGSLQTRGSLLIDSSSWMFVRAPGVKLSVTEEPQGFPFTFIPGSLTITAGAVVGTVQPILSPVQFSAVGQILNEGGGLNLGAPTDPVILKAGKGISLKGNPALINPSTLIIADTVKLETTRGNIELNNTTLVSQGDDADVSLIAPRGNITMTNTTIFVLQNSTEVGVCNFQVLKKGGTVTFGAGTALVCFPNIKK